LFFIVEDTVGQSNTRFGISARTPLSFVPPTNSAVKFTTAGYPFNGALPL
jgi:hypothetical protein